MYHYARAQSLRREGRFPDKWATFEANLPVSHVLQENTFKLIMYARDQSIEELQAAGYETMTTEDVELFDQGTAQDFLEAVFHRKEFALAAGQLQALVVDAVNV